MACLNQDFTAQERPSIAAPAIHSIFQQKPRLGMQSKINPPRTTSRDDKIIKGKRQSRWNLAKETVHRVREGSGVKTAAEELQLLLKKYLQLLYQMSCKPESLAFKL